MGGAFALLGLALALSLAGIGAQFAMQAASAPGIGAMGVADSRAAAAAGAMQRFGSQCIATASATPGLIGTNLFVDMSTAGGASTSLPAGAECDTQAAAVGRDVFAYARFQPGMVSYLARDNASSDVWFRVIRSGTAVRLRDGAVLAVPPGIPADSILNWVQIGF